MPLPDTKKLCTKCGVKKPLSDFSRQKNVKIGLSSWCKACFNKYSREYYNRPINKRRIKIEGRTRNLKRAYGINLEQYAEILLEQKGVCAICGKPETCSDGCGGICELAVDHDHNTGRVRGLLCRRCNSALGFVGDDTNILKKAIEYINAPA